MNVLDWIGPGKRGSRIVEDQYPSWRKADLSGLRLLIVTTRLFPFGICRDFPCRTHSSFDSFGRRNT